MSYQATQFVLKLTGCTPAEKAVAFALACHAHGDGGEAYPSMQTLAEESGLHYRQNVQKVMRRLEARGIIEPTSTKKGGRQLSTHYRFNLRYSSPTTAVTRVEKCSPTNAVSDPLKCSKSGGESAVNQPLKCSPTTARIEGIVVEGKKSTAAAGFSETEEKQLSEVWEYYSETFDKDEKFTSAKKKQGLAIIRRHQEKGSDPVRWMKAVVDLAKTKSQMKPYFKNWHCIFGKPETYKTLLEELSE